MKSKRFKNATWYSGSMMWLPNKLVSLPVSVVPLHDVGFKWWLANPMVKSWLPVALKLQTSGKEIGNLFWDALWLTQPLSHDHLWANHNRQMVDTLVTAVVFKGWIGQFSMNYNLLEKTDSLWGFNLASGRNFLKSEMKWTCRFKESNWCLLPVVKFELSRKILILKDTCLSPCLTTLQHWENQLETGGDINKWSFLKYYVMKCVEVWKICMT